MVFATDKLPKDCKPGELWVHSYGRTQNGTPIWVSSYCRSFPAGERKSFWQNRFKDHLEYWPNPTEKQKRWSLSEREKALRALDGIPSMLWGSKVKAIVRFDRSKDFPNQSSYGGGYIALFDAAFSKEQNLKRLLTHELAHAMWNDFPKDWKESYYQDTGWMHVRLGSPNQPPVMMGRVLGYIQEDGRIRPAEDFANNIEAFLFEPEKLREVTPGAYKWIHDRFGDTFVLR
ncbi:MAG: hypothetical protein HYW49_09960 [Deltaproteobacteria bacterium]|nr:hypothetical protein [Deltaproteobacteria bacterium]